MTALFKNLKPAKRYSKALLELLQDSAVKDGADFKEASKKMYDEFEFVVKTVRENSELQNFILNPVVSYGDKKDVMSQIFTGKVSSLTVNFLSLLAENNRLNILDDILFSFKDDINKLQNIVPAVITSVIELDLEQKKKLVENLQNKIKAEITPEFRLDEAILGGLVIKINDTVIDLSIKKKIENLKVQTF
ncbi:MAG: ATP synthase F1 subunit delta [Candidatus Gastranaerophilales bacterium]|nr:ATP synthase F1 subunit delta [Candidatus Gastranaerophilales bacterium]